MTDAALLQFTKKNESVRRDGNDREMESTRKLTRFCSRQCCLFLRNPLKDVSGTSLWRINHSANPSRALDNDMVWRSVGDAVFVQIRELPGNTHVVSLCCSECM